MIGDDDRTIRELDLVGQDATREAVAMVSERFPGASSDWCLLIVIATAAFMAGGAGVEWEDMTHLVRDAFAAGSGYRGLQ